MRAAERRTLRQSVAWSGLGLHSGEPVAVTVHPGGDGIVFRTGADLFAAHPSNVTDTSRCTRLGTISTIEHIMSALAGVEVTDAVIEVEGGELPGLDGSALPYVDGLVDAGFEKIGSREFPDLYSRMFYQDDALKIAVAKGAGQWRYVYDVGNHFPGIQAYESAHVVRDYHDDIAPARTLVLDHEIPMAQAYGLGKGLDQDSVVVLDAGGYRFPPRFSDEPARHKLLDLIGDLYLAGVPIAHLDVVAERSGHRANVQVAAMLSQAVFGSA